MGRNRTRSNRKSRQRRTRQKRRSSFRNHSAVTVTAQCVRSFAFYCPQYTDKLNSSVKSWLSQLVKYGTIALKIFTFAISVLTPSDSLGADTKHAITSAVQSVLIGVEDVLYASPLIERDNKSKGTPEVLYSVPCIDFKSARMPSASVTVTPGSAMKDRSGRYAAVLLPLTEEEYATYIPTTDFDKLRPLDSFEFKDLLQMPSCRVAPFGRSMKLMWRATPTNYAYRFLMIGQAWTEQHDPAKNIIGGKPSFRLLIGFQDFADTQGNTVTLYSASNAMVHVDIRARIQLTEPVSAFSGRRYIRDWPQVTQDATVVTATYQNGSEVTIPIEQLYQKDGALYQKSDPISLDQMALDSPA